MSINELREFSWSILVPGMPGRLVYFEDCSVRFMENWLEVHDQKRTYNRALASIIIFRDFEVRFAEHNFKNGLDYTSNINKIKVYALIPPSNPRLVLPLSNRSQLLRGLSMHRPGRATARLIVLILKLLITIGFNAPIARRKIILLGFPNLNNAVDPDSILYLGTEDSDRKTTILSPKLNEISKYGSGKLSQASLMNEANVLIALSDTTVACQVPKLLSFGSMGKGKLLRQEYRAPKRATQNWLRLEAVHFLTKLSKINFETRGGIPGHFCHGDFAPWNMIRSELGLFVFDWERGRDWAPALTDAFYSILARALHVRGPSRISEMASDALLFGRQVARAIGVDENMTPFLWKVWANDENNFSSRKMFEVVRSLKVTDVE